MAQEITNGQFQSLLFDGGPSTFVRLDQKKSSVSTSSSAAPTQSFSAAPTGKFHQLLQGNLQAKIRS